MGIKKRPKMLLITPKKMSETTKLIISEAEKVFDVSVVPINDISLSISDNTVGFSNENININDFDYIYTKIDGLRKDFGFQIVNLLDGFDVLKPYNSATVLVAHDKFLTSVVLAQHGINVPNTYLVKSMNRLNELVKDLKFPVMMKLMSGSGGSGIMYVESKEVMEGIFESMEVLNQKVLIQEFVPNPGEDIRVLVAGNEIIGAYKRVAKEGEKRANVKLGGKAVKYDINDEIKDIALRTAKAIRADICAVDILESKNAYYVIEVNINPGIKGMMEATETNIAKRLVDHILKKIENKKNYA